MMVQNTAQGEAMQAVRLLYKYAAKYVGAEHEALYQARVLLEERILNTVKLLDYTPSEVSVDRESLGAVGWIGKGVFTKGERVRVDEWSPLAKIIRINGKRETMTVEFNDGSTGEYLFETILKNTPKGSV